jgi:hypothetical protein
VNTFVDDLKESYLSWLRDRIKLNDVNGVIEITTPLMDRHNDYFQIYVTKQGDDRLRITDAGYVLSDLELDGIDVFSTPKRREMFQTILNRHGVSCSKSKEIYTEATIASFAQRKHMLLQAMIAINDLFMTSRSSVTGIFVEEIAKFFDQHDIRCTPNVAFVGRTGFTHQFDFVIPKSKSEPERVIKSLNSINKQTTSLILFSWNDTKEMRGTDSELFVFINDLTKRISEESVKAFQQYDVQAIRWSQRNEFLPRLTA